MAYSLPVTGAVSADHNLIGAGTLLGVATAGETMGPVRPAGAPDAPDAHDALRCPAMPCDAPMPCGVDQYADIFSHEAASELVNYEETPGPVARRQSG